MFEQQIGQFFSWLIGHAIEHNTIKGVKTAVNAIKKNVNKNEKK